MLDFREGAEEGARGRSAGGLAVVLPAPEPREAPRRREPPAAGGSPPTEIRVEIQALRAVAVMLVVLYHLWPDQIPGGYVGVDVFFAISGFLITSHLMREVEAAGRVSLTRFWARRARRLLPASLTTLLVCAVATIVFVPDIYWQSFFMDIRASTFYVQNWHLAASSVDYLAAADRASPVQHFWSLSAEEQFYLVWPLLITLAALTARRRQVPAVAAGVTPSRRAERRARMIALTRRRRTFLVLAAVTLASFVYSVLDTASDPQRAYFVTPTRAWEFGAGGLLALAGTSIRWPAAARTLLSWGGLALIALVAFRFSGDTPFPSWRAGLPVLGALAVIAAGAPRGRGAPTRAFRLRPVQFLGDVSYSLYLWHWPLLVLAPFVLHHGLTTPIRVGVLIAGILAAWASKVLVEDPVRRSAVLRRGGPRLTFALAAVASAGLFAFTSVGIAQVKDNLRQAEQTSKRIVAAHPRCFGAASHDPAKRCVNPALAKAVVPTTLEAKNEPNPACTAKTRVKAVSICEFGLPPAAAKRTFALIGDSHSTMWRAGMEVVAAGEQWHGLSVSHTGCPFSLATYDLPEPQRSRCVKWVKEVPRQLAKHPEVDTAFVANITGGNVFVPPGRTMAEAKVNGYQRAWASLPASIKRIVVLRDTPKVHSDTLDCVDRTAAEGKAPGPACAVRRKVALVPDPAATAARRLGPARAQVVDMTRFICTPGGRCDAVIGGVLVFKDVHHLTRVFATTLGPYLLQAVRRLERSWR